MFSYWDDLLEFVEEKNCINHRDNNGQTVLHYAAEYNNEALIQQLLDGGAYTDICEHEFGNTPLILGIRHVNVVKLLLENGASPYVQNHNLETPLHCAIKIHDEDKEHIPDIIRLLVNAKSDLRQVDKHGNSVLHSAVKYSTGEVVEFLVKNGAYVDVTNALGYTPLHLAILDNQLHTATFLINTGKGINIKDRMGNLPLHLAIMAGDEHLVELLCEKQTMHNVKNDLGYTPLHIAIKCGTLKIIKMLLEKGEDINEKPLSQIKSSLHIAVYTGQKRIVEILLAKGASVNESDPYNTPLHSAVDLKLWHIARLLIKNNANVNIKFENGDYLIHKIIEENKLGLIETIMESKHKVDVNVVNSLGHTPLYEAVTRSKWCFVKPLLKLGANVNIKTDSGETILHLAAQNADADVVLMLLESGVDVNVKNAEGYIPLNIAFERGNKDIIITLDNWGIEKGTIDNEQYLMLKETP